VGALRQILNCVLSNSILEMSIHSAESKSLAAGLARLLPGIVSKLSVITVIVYDADTMLSCKLLKCLLGSKHGLWGRVINLEIHETQSGEVAHKNSAIPAPLLCERPLQLGKKTHLC
jgi:hypothetical protein